MHPALRARRGPSIVAACVLVGCLGGVALASPAHAAAGCTTTTPTLDQLITCITAGTETITIPVGANRVEVVVIGGGGGGGGDVASRAFPGGAGGDGAEVNATLTISPGGSLDVTVGARGLGGGGGYGGQYSSLLQGATLLVIAGGGGGGGFGDSGPAGVGGSGGQGGVAAGGDGGDQGTSSTNGGSGGSGGVGGAAGTGAALAVHQGKNWSAGGDGGVGYGGSAGSGGSGYGGGGGGGDTGGSGSFPGGGAGGSYVNSSLLVGSAIYRPSTTSAGQGGAGATAGSGIIGSSGTAGTITLIFRYVVGSPAQAALVPAAQLQQVPMPRSGSCSDVDESRLDWGSSYKGGWGPSWAQWANGPVCTRTFTYNAASGIWSV